jgi:DNA-binding response OmpR family regulator
MSVVTSFGSKKILIVDDMPEMRTALRNQVGSLGCENVAVCGTVKEALERFSQERFDVVLCDYYLGPTTDGQHFLEYLRSKRLISRSTLFIMITAEKSYEKVVTAAECLPDDYLLKPFTADTLKMRIERLLAKKARLATIDSLQDRGLWSDVVTACDEIIASRDRYSVDAQRIRGNALIACGRSAEAVDFYRQVLETRAIPWARLGLARALHAQSELEGCKETLDALIAESPQFLAAYDLLGRAHLESGNPDKALSVLDQACVVAPNSLARHRTIAKVAEEHGDFARVERALNQVVTRTKNSPLRETADIARLGNAYAELGEPDKAVQLIDEARKNFKADADDSHLAAIEAIAHQKAGRPELAKQALSKALAAETGALPTDVAMAIAKACLATGQREHGEAILKSVVQSTPESQRVHSSVANLMHSQGLGDRAKALIDDSVREVISLNNEAVRRGKAGELGEAARMLTEAAHRLPGNLQIVSNAAFALLFDIFTNGMNTDKLRVAQQFARNVAARDASHPKLAEIAELQRQLVAKFGQAAESQEST